MNRIKKVMLTWYEAGNVRRSFLADDVIINKGNIYAVRVNKNGAVTDFKTLDSKEIEHERVIIDFMYTVSKEVAYEG